MTALAEAYDFSREPDVIRPCATPGCRTLGGCGTTRRFCPPCADRLAEVREWLEAQLERKYTIYGTQDRREEWDD